MSSEASTSSPPWWSSVAPAQIALAVLHEYPLAIDGAPIDAIDFANPSIADLIAMCIFGLEPRCWASKRDDAGRCFLERFELGVAQLRVGALPLAIDLGQLAAVRRWLAAGKGRN